MDREQFNVGIYAAIAKLSVRFKPKSAQKDYEGIQNTEFSDAFLLELRETLLADYDLQFSWELVQALWGWGPCQQTVAFLESMGIQRSGEGFWGFYLDGLIGAGWARRALFEIYSLCHEKRELSWARVAYGRLPEVWRLLKLRGFVWKDSDGVDSLCRRLSMRPSRRLEGVLLSGE
jgi:hypothetical protein